MNAKDEIVEEVRAPREAYIAQFNYDLAEIYRDLKAKEQEHSSRIAPLEPVKPLPNAAISS